MATFLELRNVIADDLLTGAAVTSAQISAAVKAAIADYDSRRFWFNESRTITFPTVIAQVDYSGAADVGLVLKADFIVNETTGIQRRLEYTSPDHFSYLAELDPAYSGEPYLWTWFGGSLRLYPAPDAVYTLRITGHIKFPELTADGDSNPWTREGFEVIRARAKWDLCANVTKDEAEAERAAAAEERALDRLYRETGVRTARGYIVPVEF